MLPLQANFAAKIVTKLSAGFFLISGFSACANGGLSKGRGRASSDNVPIATNPTTTAPATSAKTPMPGTSGADTLPNQAPTDLNQPGTATATKVPGALPANPNPAGGAQANLYSCVMSVGFAGINQSFCYVDQNTAANQLTTDQGLGPAVSSTSPQALNNALATAPRPTTYSSDFPQSQAVTAFIQQYAGAAGQSSASAWGGAGSFYCSFSDASGHLWTLTYMAPSGGTAATSVGPSLLGSSVSGSGNANVPAWAQRMVNFLAGNCD